MPDDEDAAKFIFHELARRFSGAPILYVPNEYIEHIPIQTRADLAHLDEIERHREKRVLAELRDKAFEGHNAPLFCLIPLVDSCGKYSLGMHLAAQTSIEPPIVVGVCQLPEFGEIQMFLVLMLVVDFDAHQQSHNAAHDMIESVTGDTNIAEGLDIFQQAARKVFARVASQDDEWAEFIGEENDVFGKNTR